MKNIFTKKILNVKEAAAYTGLSAKTLYRLRKRGLGAKYIRINASGGTGKKALVLYLRKELDLFLERIQTQTAE